MKYALITGAKSLLARAVVNSIKEDYFCFLIDIDSGVKEMHKDNPNVSFIIGDITKTEVIEVIHQEVKNNTNRLDLIIHFAGIVELGSLIEVTLETLKKVFAINLFSIYQINHTFFPLIKNFKGRIIHVSSEYGRLLGLPFHSFYTMSKHAIEIYNDSLRRELNEFGIKVVKIRPGAFKTSMQSRIVSQFEQQVEFSQLFKKSLINLQKLMFGELKRAKDAQKIVKTFRKAIYKTHPRSAYNVGNSLKMKMLNILPARMQDWVLSKFF
jgi:NAD(P)-dependent dehydrogenase (short-subunit alcohol dehydrogenase family)